MGNSNNMITKEELEELANQSGISSAMLQKQFHNFKRLDKHQKGENLIKDLLQNYIYLPKILKS